MILSIPDDGRTEIDNSLVVSMEINGIMYQGVLFAHQATRRMWMSYRKYSPGKKDAF